ncbi:klaroid isoform a-related [Anaeramoeba flamelloides]|uniref:Klaroid isoform a-related n=1 Tax=Anaeramoeba flamelloides TaxID=1746091 RepID=A0AAV8AGE4_9EUKA|nr:klaroid isoform a-related [Anaeramoeba flamelloides]
MKKKTEADFTETEDHFLNKSWQLIQKVFYFLCRETIFIVVLILSSIWSIVLGIFAFIEMIFFLDLYVLAKVRNLISILLFDTSNVGKKKIKKSLFLFILLIPIGFVMVKNHEKILLYNSELKNWMSLDETEIFRKTYKNEIGDLQSTVKKEISDLLKKQLEEIELKKEKEKEKNQQLEKEKEMEKEREKQKEQEKEKEKEREKEKEKMYSEIPDLSTFLPKYKIPNLISQIMNRPEIQKKVELLRKQSNRKNDNIRDLLQPIIADFLDDEDFQNSLCQLQGFSFSFLDTISNEIAEHLVPYLVNGQSAEHEFVSSDLLDQLKKRTAQIIQDTDETLVDYASINLGAKVVKEHSSATYKEAQPITRPLQWINSKLSSYPKHEAALDSSLRLGDCWPFSGSNGNLTVQLAHTVSIDSFAIDHSLETKYEKNSSAPKNLRIFYYDLHDKDLQSPKLILNDEFDFDSGFSKKIYYQGKKEIISRVIKLEILDNYGNQNWTCLYRFRVYGFPVSS